MPGDRLLGDGWSQAWCWSWGRRAAEVGYEAVTAELLAPLDDATLRLQGERKGEGWMMPPCGCRKKGRGS